MNIALRPVKPARCRRNDCRTESQVSGLVMSSYYAGLVAGCLWGRGIISQVGHIRAFAAFAATVAATTLIYALWFDPVAWATDIAASFAEIISMALNRSDIR